MHLAIPLLLAPFLIAATEACAGGGIPVIIDGRKKREAEKEEARSELGSCLHKDTLVQAENGDHVKVSALSPGDKVLAFSAEKGVHFSPVLFDMFIRPNDEREFVQIETESGNRLLVTPEHTVFGSQCGASGWKPLFANHLRKGMCVPSFVNGGVAHDRVTRVSNLMSVGVHQPVTETGTIVAANITVSCYDWTTNQEVAHALLTPFKYIYKAAEAVEGKWPWLLEGVSNLLSTDVFVWNKDSVLY